MVAHWLIQSVFIPDLLRLIASYLHKYEVAIRFVCRHEYLSLKSMPYPWDEWVCQYSAEYGQLSVLQSLRAQEPPCPWDDSVCEYAARNGNLSVL